MSIKVATEPRVDKGSSGRKPSAKDTRGFVVTSPRVDLLPPEIGERNRQAGVRRGLRFVVLGALILVVLAIAGAWYLATSAHLALAGEQSHTQSLVAQQGQYTDVRTAQDAIKLGEAAQKVGASTEIDWRSYLATLQKTLPANVVLAGVTIDSADIIKDYAQSDVPLEGARIATLTFTARTKTLPSIPSWLNRLETLPGFVDATPGTVTLTADGYIATITMHINSDAYDNRFTTDAATSSTDTATTTDGATDSATGDGQ